MLIAEESDRKRREKQKKGYPPKWGDHTLTRMRVGHAARQLNFQHAPSAQAADPREPFMFLTAVFMWRGARVMWSRGLYFHFAPSDCCRDRCCASTRLGGRGALSS